MIPDGFALVAMRFGAGAAMPNDAEITFGINQSPDSLDAATIADIVLAVITSSSVYSCWAQQLTMTSIYVKKGPDATGGSAELATTVSGGRPSGTVVPPNSAALVKKTTALGGRKNRGRFYLPGMREVDVDEVGNLTAGYLTTCQPIMDQFLTDLSSGLIPMVLLHGDATTPTPVTSLEIQSRLGTQRRRMRS